MKNPLLKPLVAAGLAAYALAASPASAAPAGCVKPAAANAVTVVAPAGQPVVGVALVGPQPKKNGEIIPGDGANTTVADASDRCPAGYVQQYFQQPATRPIQYQTAATVVDVVTASPDVAVTPPRN